MTACAQPSLEPHRAARQRREKEKGDFGCVKPVGGHLLPSIRKPIMTDSTCYSFFPTASCIVHALGPAWQFEIADDASQIIAFPVDRTIHLRFVRAGGAAPAIAVEIVDAHGHPAAEPPDPAIWLLPYGLSTEAAVRQIKTGLIEPYRATPKGHPAFAA